MLQIYNTIAQKLCSIAKKNKEKEKFTYLISLLIPGGLLVAFFVLVVLNFCVEQQLGDLTIRTNLYLKFRLADYPLLDNTSQPAVSATSAIIMDATSHVLLYQKNTDFLFSPASTTKIMTALVSLEYYHPADILTVKDTIDTQGSGLGLFTGEKISFVDLLKAALIYSANDAAVTIAQNYPGGEPQFVTAMNRKAQALHLSNTHFGDPDGLNDAQDYTTAKDLVQLAAIAMQNPLFASIVRTKYTEITSADGLHTYTFKNRNILLGLYGINGIKTGYTDEAGEVLATSVVKNGHTFYIIVMKSQDRFADTKKLLSVLDQVSYVSLNFHK